MGKADPLPPAKTLLPTSADISAFFGAKGPFSPLLPHRNRAAACPKSEPCRPMLTGDIGTSGGTPRRGENRHFSSATLRGKTPQTTPFDKGHEYEEAFNNRTTTGFFLPQKLMNQVTPDALNRPCGLRTVTKEPYFRLPTPIP